MGMDRDKIVFTNVPGGKPIMVARNQDFTAGVKPKYKIIGTFEPIIDQTTGQYIRYASVFTQYLSTEKGVLRFVDMHKPFQQLVVIDLTTNQDVTKEFFK
jgi:hypothetical protein